MVHIVVLVNIRSGNLKMHPKQGFTSKEEADRWVYDHIVKRCWPSYEGPCRFMMWLPTEDLFDNVIVWHRNKLFK